MKYPVFSDLLGKTITVIDDLEVGNDKITFTTSDGSQYRLYHTQICCEYVSIEDVSGDVADLIGEPLLLAEESTSDENPKGVTPEIQDKSFTWTFYRLATRKGVVVIRWYGESNGFYSESVDFCKVEQASAGGRT